jgi:hypothetical protein
MKILELDQCGSCPWLKYLSLPRCGHPKTLDKHIEDTTEIPKWCPLDDKEDT